jgi:Gas vesicle synthesis protein GvpL/GvpF
MGLYLYAVLPDRYLEQMNALEVMGIDGQAVQFFAIPPFAIAHSEAKQERYLASRANLLTHEKVIETYMQALEAERIVPLPLQFGLVVSDWQQVKQELITDHDRVLLSLLEKLAGKREVGIKLFWDQVAELNLLLEENATLQKKRESLVGKLLSMDEAIDIGQELEACLEARQQEIITSFLALLRPLSYEYVEGELLTENMLYNASFLIDWEKEEEFASAVEKLDGEFNQRLRIRYNNFTAPYNFVDLD